MTSLFRKKAIFAAVAIVVILLLMGAGLLVYFKHATEAKAAIIDQLSSSNLTSSSRYVNQTFIEATRTLLSTHFPEVDYYSDNATVDNYRSLPSDGYKLIIWRAHSAIDESGRFIAISTSENNGTSDYPQYSNGELTLCDIFGDPRMYFAITPKFITEVMSGRFDDTVIILMSCNGLKEGYTKTAETLEEKGAKAIISWDGWIEDTNNDGATALLLNYLINGNDTIQQAVKEIPQQQSSRGPSQMQFSPTSNETAEYRIPNYNQKTTTSSVWFDAMPTLRNAKAEGSNRASHELEVDSTKLLNVSTALKRSRPTGCEELRRQD